MLSFLSISQLLSGYSLFNDENPHFCKAKALHLKDPQVTLGLKDAQVPGLQYQAHYALDLGGWYKLDRIRIINFLL